MIDFRRDTPPKTMTATQLVDNLVEMGLLVYYGQADDGEPLYEIDVAAARAYRGKHGDDIYIDFINYMLEKDARQKPPGK